MTFRKLAFSRLNICVLFNLLSLAAAAQNFGDYRTTSTGNWNSIATWETYNGTAWLPAATAPDYLNGALEICSGHTVTMTSSVTVDQLSVNGILQVGSAATLNVNNGTGVDINVNGTIIHSGIVPASVNGQGAIGSGGFYVHNTTSSASRMVDFFNVKHANSSWIYRGSGALTPSVSLAGKTFGNLVFESVSGSWPVSYTGSGALTVNGNFMIGNGVIMTNSNTGANLFKGHFTIDGTLTNSTGSQLYHFGGTAEQIITGNGSIAFETFQVNNNAMVKLANNVSISAGFTATINGTIDLDDKTLSGSGNLSISTGATIKTAHVSGLNASLSVTGSKAYGNGVNFIFYGTSPQISGTDLPATVNHLTVDNSASLQLSNASITIAGNLVINSGKKLEIGPGKLVTVNGTTVNHAGTAGLVILSDQNGSGNLVQNTSNVYASVQRYITGKTSPPYPYHFISAPVGNAALNQVWQNGDYNIYWYDETNNDIRLDQGWTRYINGNMAAGRGYAIVSDYANRTITFNGTLNIPPLGAVVSYTNTSPPYPYNLDPRGWNLVGNPFPCALSVSNFLNDNTASLATGAVYFWDDVNGDSSRAGDYAVHNGTGGIGSSQNSSNIPNGKIALGQAFFVRVNSGASSLIFSSSQRTTNNSPQFFIPDTQRFSRLRLSLGNSTGSYNEILIGFLEEATDSVDLLYDAIKLKGNPDIALYSIIDGRDYAIQGLPPLLSSRKVAIGCDLAKSGSYNFRLKSAENFSSRTHILLEDKIMHTYTNLVEHPEYSFYSEAGYIRDRFVLHFSLPSASVDNNSHPTELEFYSYAGRIYISGNYNIDYPFIVTDLYGRILMRIKPDTSQTVINFGGLKGLFLVHLMAGNKMISRKIFME